MNIPLLQVAARVTAGLGLAVVLLTGQQPLSEAAGSAPLGGPVLWLLAAGIGSGFLAGLLGIGGALVTVPAFYLALPALGVPFAFLPQAVVACSLLSMLPTTIAGIRCHVRNDSLDFAMVKVMAPRMAVGAVLGALVATTLRGPVLALTFAAQALYYGGRLLHGGARAGPASRVARVGLALPMWLTVPSISAFCACVGMGGGSMVVPYLMARGLSLHRAVATGSALNLCIALGGSAVFIALLALSPASLGAVCWPAGLAVGAVAVVAVPSGVALARRLATRRLGFLVGLINVAGALSLVAQVAAAPAWRSAPIEPPATASELETQWRQRALNALLVPLLDDSFPPHWAEPTIVTPCTNGSNVSLEGAPIPYRAPLGAGPLVIRWKLVDCWPLGFDAWGLDGGIEMTVVVGEERLLAQVRPRDLIAKTQAGRQHLSAPFQSELALGTPPSKP